MAYNIKNPYRSRLKGAEVLTKPGSQKDTRHFEIDLAGSEMTFEPGDSLAIKPSNCPELVEDIVRALGVDGSTEVTGPNKDSKSLREVLLEDCAITAPDKKFLQMVVDKAGGSAKNLAELLHPDKKDALADYLWGREVIDILLAYPQAKFEPQEFVGSLRKLLVRLYSIASSLKAYPEEVHLTVATVIYESFGRMRKGVCSTFLADRVDESTLLPCFITPGKGFRLPDPDDDTPIIMIGPGTGIAPFRAFLQERKATNAKGKAWLFFGEQQRATDYFYEDEWNTYLEEGCLHRLDLAFSRDQAYKIYVQHRMKEQAEEFWSWLEEGAIVYVCGDAARMAKDVDRALHEIAEEAGGKSPEEAVAFMEQLKSDKRYRRDVY